VSHQLLLRLLLCIFVSAFLLYSYIDRQNDITEMKFFIPKLAEEVRALSEENATLLLEVEQIENPKVLLEKMRLPEFSHLKEPLPLEVIRIDEEAS